MNAVLRDNWKYFSGALLIHAVLAALLFVTINTTSRQTPIPQLAIKATLVDQSTLNQLSRAQAEKEEAQRQAAEAEKKRQQDEADRQRQKEQEDAQREADKLKAQQQAERQKEIDKQKQMEAQLQDEARQRQAAEEQKRAQALAEQKRVAEIQQKQREAEQKRQADTDAKAQAAREAELKRQLASEEGEVQAVNAGLQNQYVALIQQAVMRRWIKPASAKPGVDCEVKVTQATGGTVLSAQVTRCNGDAAVRQSIETAVLSASPLPAPPDPRVFQRNLVFNFKPVE